MKNFGIIGVGGFVAPRHLKAIRETGNQLVVACDPFDSVGVMDQYFPEANFFTEIERFDRHLEKLRRKSDAERVDYISVCTPNYLHDAHTRLALRVGANAICEKPLVVNPWNLDQLAALESEVEGNVYAVLQLRLMDSLKALREQIQDSDERHSIDLSYITRRGRWYHRSWKGAEEKSGGLVMNIGIHFFDLLLWLYGDARRSVVHAYEADYAAGFLELEKADVRWYLSIRAQDLPQHVQDAGGHAYRLMTMDGGEVEFSTGFTDLHTELYRETLAGRGFTLGDARPSIELGYKIRTSRPQAGGGERHPLLR